MSEFSMNIDEQNFIKPKPKGQLMKKFWTILCTLLVLLIPIAFLHGIIDDRENYRKEAVDTIASSWGNSQVIVPPVLYFKQKKEKDEIQKYFPVNNYNVDIQVSTEVRKKGIFKVPVYTADVLLKGDFKNIYGTSAPSNVFMEISVKDSTGFIEEPQFKIGNNSSVKTGSTQISTTINPAEKYIPFEITYKLRGLNDLYMNVDGQSNKFSVKGNWSNPSFVGNFLPSERTIDKQSFSAEWSVPKIATSSLKKPQIGVSLLVPVDNYRMADRTLKYAFLFLALTFLSYFVFEIVSKDKRKIHPLQYCMLGAAIQIFYLLLVSISEFLPFGAAYLISALMILALIGMYTYFVLTKAKGKVFSILIVALMAILYAFLYVLLLLQDFALLLGSFGMFIIIAAIMYVTKDVEWYSEE